MNNEKNAVEGAAQCVGAMSRAVQNRTRGKEALHLGALQTLDIAVAGLREMSARNMLPPRIEEAVATSFAAIDASASQTSIPVHRPSKNNVVVAFTQKPAPSS